MLYEVSSNPLRLRLENIRYVLCHIVKRKRDEEKMKQRVKAKPKAKNNEHERQTLTNCRRFKAITMCVRVIQHKSHCLVFQDDII